MNSAEGESERLATAASTPGQSSFRYVQVDWMQRGYEMNTHPEGVFAEKIAMGNNNKAWITGRSGTKANAMFYSTGSSWGHYPSDETKSKISFAGEPGGNFF